MVGLLTQTGERLQGHEPRFRVVEQRQDFIAHGGFDLFVPLALLRSHFGIKYLFGQFGKIGSHLFFRPPEKKRPDPAEQARFRAFVVLFFNRQLELLPECFVGAEGIGVDEFHLCPQIGQRILNRGA